MSGAVGIIFVSKGFSDAPMARQLDRFVFGWLAASAACPESFGVSILLITIRRYLCGWRFFCRETAETAYAKAA